MLEEQTSLSLILEYLKDRFRKTIQSHVVFYGSIPLNSGESVLVNSQEIKSQG